MAPFALVFTSACTLQHYRDEADREAKGVLDQAMVDVLGGRRAWVQRPKELPPTPPADPAGAAVGTTPADPTATSAVPPAASEPAPAGSAPSAGTAPGTGAAEPPPPQVPVPAAAEAQPDLVRFDLPKALATATESNRDFRTRRESLYSQGLSFALTQFEYGPQFRSALNYLWPDQQIGQGSHGGGFQVGMSQRLPTNGTIELSAGGNGLWPYGEGAGPNNFTSNVGISLSQPLLRGFGTRVWRESLTQAERDLTYQIRDFEDFRQSFTIQIAQQYFELVRQQQTLANEETNFQNAVFDRGRAEALWAVERLKQEEVFRARRTEIQAKDALISARASYAQALDRFKIQLGIPTTTAIELESVEPPFEPVRVEPDSAVQCALHNRLDLVTERQRLEDTERALRLAENGLLPDLSLTAGYALGGFAEDWCDAEPNFWTSNVGLSMSVPLQQNRERNSFRQAEIRLEQARRGLSLLEDNLNLEIRNAIRNLHSIEQRIDLQAQQVLAEQRAVEVMRIRFESDNVSNRDLLEARRAYVNTQNELIRLKIEHFISRLQLQKDLGVLFVDERGMWQ